MGAEENAFEPEPFPRNDSVPVIAPYWQDFDIYGAGEIYYRLTSESFITTRVAFEVLITFATVFKPKEVIIVTWDHVGFFYRQSNKVSQSIN